MAGDGVRRDKYVYSAAGGKKPCKLINATIYFNKGLLVSSCDRLILTSCFNSTNACVYYIIYSNDAKQVVVSTGPHTQQVLKHLLNNVYYLYIIYAF